MKKIIAVLLSVFMAASALTGCGTADPTEKKSDQIKVVATIFPIYDWVKEVAGDDIDVNLDILLDNGVDLHSFQPTAKDIMDISDCDIFIYVGGESDKWVDETLAQADNKDMIVLDLMDILADSVKTEEVKEGMEADHDHEHGHDEIEETDIKDRTLAEFNGEWKSLIPLLNNGDLDEYVEHEAEEESETKENITNELAEKWACNATEIAIKDNKITFTYEDGKTAEAEYTYAGYSLKKDEDGDITGVRYQFETDSANAPKYVQFNDHGHEPAEEVEHFHVYFGNESFGALTNASANPFFVPKKTTAEEVLSELMEGHEHEEENDEHVWLSLKCAEKIVQKIANALSKKDAQHADVFKDNAAAYTEKLSDLDQQYQTAVDNAAVKTLLFGDRFPFRYMTDDYGLDYYAAFAGCSAETEASFETILFLADKVDELGLKTIMQIEGSDGSIAKTIKDNTAAKDQQILTLDSLQNVTRDRIDAGETYLSIMQSNLDVLKQALS
ncbi:MAG: zinc ABC transporter substrate-binding protein [Ruminococcus sp.]|nr:zinc ABC transporter substrate-binding protein [Ruminococcus sp.]